MEYTLAGFTHDLNRRIFEFVGTNDEKQRSAYRVTADLALISRYGIRVQELPLLCRGVLDRRDAGDERHAFTFTEADMSSHAELRVARAAEAEKKKPQRRPVSTHVGTAWRQPAVAGFSQAGIGSKRDFR